MSDKLTRKQEAFCKALLDGKSLTDAYRTSYSALGMKAEVIYVEASRLAANPKLTLRLAEMEAARLRREQTTVDRVVAEYSKLAFLDVRKAFRINAESGKEEMIPIGELDDDTAAAIAGWEFEEVYDWSTPAKSARKIVGRIHKIKLNDKRGALDSIAKYLGMLTDRVQHSGSVTVTHQDYTRLTDEELATLERLAAKAAAPAEIEPPTVDVSSQVVPEPAKDLAQDRATIQTPTKSD